VYATRTIPVIKDYAASSALYLGEIQALTSALTSAFAFAARQL